MSLHMRAAMRIFAGATALLAVASMAHAGDQGDPEKSCDGNTFQMVECLKAKAAQWDKRLNIAYQKAVQDALEAFARDFGYDLDEEGEPLEEVQAA